jgi:natural product precursor
MKITKLKLPQLLKADLDERKMNLLRGGELTVEQLIYAAWAATPGGTCSDWVCRQTATGQTVWCADIFYDEIKIGNSWVFEDSYGCAVPVFQPIGGDAPFYF